jgi:hypothetical protein
MVVVKIVENSVGFVAKIRHKQNDKSMPDWSI